MKCVLCNRDIQPDDDMLTNGLAMRAHRECVENANEVCHKIVVSLAQWADDALGRLNQWAKGLGWRG